MNTNKHPLPIGARIQTIGGAAQGDWDCGFNDEDEEVERRTEPGDWGEVISADLQADGWVYGVVFDDCGAWVFLDAAELDNPAQYRVGPVAAPFELSVTPWEAVQPYPGLEDITPVFDPFAAAVTYWQPKADRQSPSKSWLIIY